MMAKQKHESAGIRRDEWMQALASIGHTDENDPSALTTAEFAQLFAVTLCTAESKLAALVKAGKATRTQKIQSDSNGRVRRYVAYRLA